MGPDKKSRVRKVGLSSHGPCVQIRGEIRIIMETTRIPQNNTMENIKGI